MQHRRPSTSLNPRLTDGDNAMRRRSGGPYPDSSRSSTLADSASGRASPTSTVFLVRSSNPSPVLPTLPALTPIAGARVSENEAFSSVVLTPRPATPTRSTSQQSTESRGTRMTRLPTPDFPPTRPASLRSFVPAGLGLMSLYRQASSATLFSASTATLVDTRPKAARTESESSVQSASTAVDSGHRFLIPSIGTTAKFTHKWPAPRGTSVRSKATGGALERAAAEALEDGVGLGMDRVERWTSFKWALLLSVCTIFAYGGAGLVCALMTWFPMWDYADVMYVADGDILILITLAASVLLFAALVGASGTLLNSRALLAVYALLLWPAFVALLAIGYTAYKRSTFALEAKLSRAWSEDYTLLGRRVVQDALHCCGFFSVAHDAAPSSRCYARTALPGCKGRLYRFEQASLAMVWSATFALVPLHLVNIATALICANHVTSTFGKGITPKKYRLNAADLRADAVKIVRAINSDGGPVVRPAVSRAGSSGIFREDKDRIIPWAKGVR